MSEENKTEELKTSGNANKSVPKKPAKKTNQIAGQGMKKDTVTTLLFKTNHQNFAEVFNHTVLAKAPISPEDLQEEDIKETAYLQITKEGGGTTMVQYRDVVKGVQERAEKEERKRAETETEKKTGTKETTETKETKEPKENREKKNRRNERQMKLLLAILGIENQEDIHYGMPFRVLEIDFVNYARQIRNIENRHQEEWKDETGHRHLPADITKEEYLGKFLKTDKLLPCITLVVYWGEKPWDGPRRLSDLFTDCPWASLAWDMELNLLDVQRLSEEEICAYTGELRTVFGFMKYARDKEGLERFIENNPKYFTEVSGTALQVLDELTHAPELKALRNPQYQTQEGEFNMSTAIQEMILEGKQEGRKEGKREGRREGKKEGKLEQAQKTAKNLQKLGLDEVSIAKMVEMELGLVRQWLQADE